MPNTYEMLNTLKTPAEVKSSSTPASVERVMGVQFEFSVSGYLCCATVDTEINCLVGVVYRETRGRFRDGSTIRTSWLRRRFESRGYHVFETFNRSAYVVCE